MDPRPCCFFGSLPGRFETDVALHKLDSKRLCSLWQVAAIPSLLNMAKLGLGLTFVHFHLGRSDRPQSGAAPRVILLLAAGIGTKEQLAVQVDTISWNSVISACSRMRQWEMGIASCPGLLVLRLLSLSAHDTKLELGEKA